MIGRKLGRKPGINRYLVDVTISRNAAPVPDNYNFAHSKKKTFLGIDPTVRVATQVSAGDRGHNFIETVSRQRDMDVFIYTDRFQAILCLTID